MGSKQIKNMVYIALFIAIGAVLPFLTGQIKEIGDSLLPMHFAVLTCGLLLGWKQGLTVGAILPIFRGICFGMPPIYPSGIWMTFELATYGFLSGFLYEKFGKGKITSLYFSLLISQICGRIVWGIAKTLILGFSGKSFMFSAFIAEGFVDALAGLIVQWTLIPIVIKTVEKALNVEKK